MGGGGGMNWEIGIDICTLICIKLITNKNLLYTNKIKFKTKKLILCQTQYIKVTSHVASALKYARILLF